MWGGPCAAPQMNTFACEHAWPHGVSQPCAFVAFPLVTRTPGTLLFSCGILLPHLRNRQYREGGEDMPAALLNLVRPLEGCVHLKAQTRLQNVPHRSQKGCEVDEVVGKRSPWALGSALDGKGVSSMVPGREGWGGGCSGLCLHAAVDTHSSFRLLLLLQDVTGCALPLLLQFPFREKRYK